MMANHANDIDKALAGLTRWPEGETALWDAALATAEQRRGDGWVRFLLLSRKGNALAAGVFLAVLIGWAAVGPYVGGGESGSPVFSPVLQTDATKGANQADESQDSVDMWSMARSPESYATPGRSAIAGCDELYAYQPENQKTDAADEAEWESVRSGATPKQWISPSSTDSPIERQVVRTATIELETDDVRAVFFKVQMIPQAAAGEFIQDSSLHGDGKYASGQLTLRVASSRLSDVLNSLRDLATVKSEVQGGQDVTARFIDADARLRNERRIEQELLDLLDSRKDSPLAEVLKLRESLNRVRQSIEELTGERQQLSRLVALSSVLVLIQAKDGPVETAAPDSIWGHFTKSVGESCRSGLEFLADTVARLLLILVGGLVWWLLLITGLLCLRRYLQRRAG